MRVHFISVVYGYKLNSHLTCFRRGFIARSPLPQSVERRYCGGHGFESRWICQINVLLSLHELFKLSYHLSLIKVSVLHLKYPSTVQFYTLHLYNLLEIVYLDGKACYPTTFPHTNPIIFLSFSAATPANITRFRCKIKQRLD